MTTVLAEQDPLPAARTLVDAAQEAVATAIAAAAELTDGGKTIDDHEVHAERVGQVATFARAAEVLVASC